MLLHSTLADRAGHDLRLTRPLLERMPVTSMHWRPHPRAFSLAGLGTHLAQLPRWGVQILTGAGHDLALAGARARPELSSREDVIAAFDRSVDEWQGAVRAVTAEALSEVWRLHRGAVVLEALTRADAIERYLLHHLIHHRGQLTVYLRMLGVPLPPLYGPSADEAP